MQNFKVFIFLGLLFGVVLITSTVTADEKAKDENEAVVDGAAKETIPVEVDDVKQGCGRCCWKGGNHYCGRGCCSPEKEETEAVENAAAYEANPDGWGGDRGGSATYEDNNEVNPDRWGGGGKGGGGKGGGGKGGGGKGGGGRGGGGRGGGGRGGGGKGGGGGSGGGLGGGGK